MRLPVERDCILSPLLDQYIDGLYGYAMALSRNRAEAEDLVQETYLRALQALNSLRPDGNVKAWLFTILRNIWINQLRRRRVANETVELEPNEMPSDVSGGRSKDPLALYVSSLEREQVRSAIQRLPVEFREIIVLREYEEMSYQEIASFLGCAQGTVMSRLSRARAKLRELLSVPTANKGGATELQPI
jgi:RNA polymerase sigma-70 factor (ECF subfamily)